MVDRIPVTDGLLDRVLERLGLTGPPAIDRTGLDDLYRTWCHGVPFDNTRKLIALRSGRDGPLPGIEPAEFLETWLEHGTGGTCWPSCNALFAVVEACGFEARRVTASMGDMGQPNHGTILVRLDDGEYLVDSAMLLNRAVKIRPGETVMDDHPLMPIEYETVDGTVGLWFQFAVLPAGAALPCRLMTRGVDDQLFREAYEASRAVGPFNEQLFASCNFPGRSETLHGRRQVTRREGGAIETKEHDADSLTTELTSTMGLSPTFVDRWVASGALEASLEDRAPPEGPPVSELPPSRRG